MQGEFGSLRAGLTSRSIEAKATDYLVTDLSSGEASTYRDVLCKTIYGRLFTWLINRINETIKVGQYQKYRINKKMVFRKYSKQLIAKYIIPL